MLFFGSNFSFRSHVSSVCRSCRYHIRDLRRIRLYLTFDSAKLLAHALVSSRLECCNYFYLVLLTRRLFSFNVSRTPRLVAVTKKTSFDPQCSTTATPSLAANKFRIEFKTCLLTYKTFNDNQPDYTLC